MFSVQEYLKDPGMHTIANPQQTQMPSVCHGKLVDNPSIMPVFTIEYVVDYFIYQKKEDNMRADQKSFKAGGFKLFKEGHVQNIMVHQQGTVFEIDCRCLPEMKKDKVYKIKVEISNETSSDHPGEGYTNSFKHTKHTE